MLFKTGPLPATRTLVCQALLGHSVTEKCVGRSEWLCESCPDSSPHIAPPFVMAKTGNQSALGCGCALWATEQTDGWAVTNISAASLFNNTFGNVRVPSMDFSPCHRRHLSASTVELGYQWVGRDDSNYNAAEVPVGKKDSNSLVFVFQRRS